MKQKCSKCKKLKTNTYIHSRRLSGNHVYWCRECNTERFIKYRATKHGKETLYKAIYKSIEKLNYKQEARYALNKALRTGIISKSKHCERCKSKKTEGHHDDYSKPLEVRWLCRSHHADVHREIDARA